MGGTLIRFEHVIDHIIRPLIHLLREQIHEKIHQIQTIYIGIQENNNSNIYYQQKYALCFISNRRQILQCDWKVENSRAKGINMADNGDRKNIADEMCVSAKQCMYPYTWRAYGQYQGSIKVLRKYSYLSVIYRLSIGYPTRRS